MNHETFAGRAQRKLGRWYLLTRKRLLHAIPRNSSIAQRFVFVAGAQRSGTNMLMDILERSDATDVYHERDTRAFKDYVMRQPKVIRKLAENSRAPVFVIKSLCELDRLPALMEEFAPSRLVWIVRDYRDMINSALVSFPSLPRSMAQIYADRTAADWRSRGLSDATYGIIRKLYRPGIDDASAVALFWYMRNVLFFENRFDRMPNSALTLYEPLVTEPDQELRRIFEFLELEYSRSISRHVFASSIRRRPAPAIDPEIDAVCTELHGQFVALRNDRIGEHLSAENAQH